MKPLCFFLFFTFLSNNALSAGPWIPVSGPQTYMGSWDLDGSGTSQAVYNSVVSTEHSLITVTDTNGISSYYDVYISGIGASWKLIGVDDLDGAPGLELILSVKTSNTSTEVQVISHREKKLNHTAIGRNVADSSWSLLGIVDTDGKPGKELVLNVVNYSGFFHHYEFIHFNGGITVSSYYENSATSAILLGDKFTDTDGIPGMEVIVNVSGKFVRIIHDKSQSTSYIDMNSYSAWSVIGFSDLNGVAGNEIVIRTNAQSVLAYNDIQQTSYGFTVAYDWSFAGFVNQNGQPGNEIMFNTSNGLKYLTYGSQLTTPPPTQPTQPTQPSTTNVCGFVIDNNQPLSGQYFRIYETDTLSKTQLSTDPRSLSIEYGTLENGGSPQHWWSAMWYLEKVDGYYRILNRWTGKQINIERGIAEVSSAESYWWSAMWSLETSDKSCTIKNRWKNNYLSKNNNFSGTFEPAIMSATTQTKWSFLPLDQYPRTLRAISNPAPNLL
jgi:hypothetical protein